jgi:hypothetical protein
MRQTPKLLRGLADFGNLMGLTSDQNDARTGNYGDPCCKGCLPIKCLTIRSAFVIEAGLVLRLAGKAAALEVPATVLARELQEAAHEPK